MDADWVRVMGPAAPVQRLGSDLDRHCEDREPPCLGFVHVCCGGDWPLSYAKVFVYVCWFRKRGGWTYREGGRGVAVVDGVGARMYICVSSTGEGG